MRLSHLLVFAIILCATACTGRGPATAALAPYAGTDFAAMAEKDYRQAVKDIAGVLGEKALDADVERRTHGPLAVLALGDDRYLVAVQAKDLQLTLYVADNGSGRSAPCPVIAGRTARAVRPVTHTGIRWPLVAVETADKEGRTARIIYAVTGSGLPAIRCEDGQGRLLREAMPSAVAGDLASADVVEQLAALHGLMSESRKAERGKAGILSHLQKLAASTDAWVAEVAAEVLTLPRE